MAEFTKDTNKATADLIKSTNGAVVSEKAKTAALKTSTVAAKASAVATKALRVALSTLASIGISVAINGIITLITNLVNAQQEAIDKANELADAYKNEKQDLESLKQEYLDIVDSEESESEKSKKLIEFKEKLIEKYKEEKDAIEGVTTARATGIKFFDDEIAKNAEDIIADNGDAYRNAINAMYHPQINNKSLYAGANTTLGDIHEQVSQLLKDFNISASLIKYEYGGTGNFEFDFGEDIYDSVDNITRALNYFDEKINNGGQLTDLEKNLKSFLKSEKERLDKVIEDNSEIVSTTNDAYVTKYLHEYLTGGNTLDNVTEDSFDEWKQGLLDSIKKQAGDLANNSSFAQALQDEIDRIYANLFSGEVSGGSILLGSVDLTTLNEAVETLSGSASTFSSALKEIASGGSIDTSSMQKLIEIIPELANSFTILSDGSYTTSYHDLNSAIKSYLETKKEELAVEQEELETKRANIAANLAEKQSELDRLKQYQNYTPNSAYESQMVAEAKAKVPQLENEIETGKNTLSEIDVALAKQTATLQTLSSIVSQTVGNFVSVEDEISKLKNSFTILNDAQTEFAENGKVTTDTLSEISSLSDDMAKAVAEFLTTDKTEADYKKLFSTLKDYYEQDKKNFSDLIVAKAQTDEQYTSSVYKMLGDQLDKWKDLYGVDLRNYKTLAQSKLEVEKQLITNLASQWSEYYKVIVDEVTGIASISGTPHINSASDYNKFVQSGEQKAWSVVNNQVNSYNDIIRKLNDAAKINFEDIELDFKSSSSSSSSKGDTSSFFDWVQVKLERLKTITSNFIDSITETISKKQSEAYLNKAIKAVRNEKTANEKAIQTYTAAANKIGLSSYWQKKVQNGDYSLDDIKNSDLAEKIQKYQDFWDKIESCKQNIKDLTQQEQELIIQTEDLNLDDLEYKANRKNYAVTVAEGKITTKDLKGKRVTSKDYEAVNKALTAENVAINSRISNASMIQSKYDPTSERYRELQEIIESGKQALQDNTDAMLENNKKITDLKIADYSSQAHAYNRKVELGQTRISLAQAEGKKINASSYQYLIDNTEKENEILRQQRTYIQGLQAKTEEGSELWSDYQSQLEEINDTIYSNRIQQAEWNAEARDIPMEQLKSTLEMTDAYLETFKSYASMMEYVHGKSSITVDMINNQKWSDEAFEKQVELYKDYWNEYISAMDEGRTADAEKYFKLYSQEYQTYTDMLVTNEELNRQARDITLYRNYEKDLEHIEEVKKAISSLEGILNDDALFNDDGSFSKQGIAKIALTINQLEQARASVANYQKQLDALNANRNQYKSEDEFNEKLKELTDGYQSATSEVNQYTEAIKDLYKNQAQEELNVLNELIDAREKCLQRKKDYYSYDKTIRNKTKDITAMQMQIEALNGVSTAEAKAQKALLQEQLKGLEEDLADTQAEHIYQVQIDGLNEQKEILQDIYDTFVDSLNKCLDTEQEIISSASYLAVDSIQAVNDLLKEIANSRGYDINYIGDTLPHFADGGLVKSKGKDDGLAWLKAGEYVLNENAYKAFKYSVPAIDSAAQKMTKLVEKIDNGGIGQSFNVGDINLIVQGNVDKNVMADLKKYQKQLTDSVISTITKDLIKTGYKR